MTVRASDRPYRLIPSESSATWVALEKVLRPIASSEQVLSNLEGHTATSQRRTIARTVRPYTDEELRMIEKADEYPADLREKVRAFLEG
jgi:hypothetical protein